MLSSTYVVCLCAYFAVIFMAMLDRFSVIFKCRKTAWWSFAIILMGKITKILMLILKRNYYFNINKRLSSTRWTSL